MLSVDKPTVHWKINTLSITFVDLCQRKVLLIFKLIEDPTTRIPIPPPPPPPPRL